MIKVLPIMLGGFMAGVLWRSFVVTDLASILLLLCIAGALLALAMLRSFHGAHYLALAVLACLIGVVRTELAIRAYEAPRTLANDSAFMGEGYIAAEPDVRDGYAVLYVDTTTTTSALRFRMKVPPYPAYTYGDVVTVSGTVHIPESFETDTGRVFDYPGYLMKDGVHYELRDPTVTATGGRAGSTVVRTLLALKHRWLAAVSRLIPEPEASLAGGVVVGAKRALGDKWLDAFRTTGIIHIVVLSGYNLTLVAQSIIRMTSVLPRTAGLGLGSLGVVAFALMTGASSTVVRASVMAILGMFAVYAYRPYNILRALGFAAALMVLWNPFTLAFDPGFQLSFVATVGLILGHPLLERQLLFVPAFLELRSIVAATLATQVAVLPLLMYQIGAVSLVAPFVNVLVLPFVPAVMALGFMAGLVGLGSLTLAVPFAWSANLLLSYMFTVVSAFSALPFASLMLPPLPWWSVAVAYVFLAVVYHVVTQNTTRTKEGGVVANP